MVDIVAPQSCAPLALAEARLYDTLHKRPHIPTRANPELPDMGCWDPYHRQAHLHTDIPTDYPDISALPRTSKGC